MSNPEIRYLRPQQLLDRMQACPVAYIPLGVLEWHGEHNPFGADTLQAEGIAVACAQHGGVVYPPLYYGLFQDRMETIPRFQRDIIKRMGWRAENFDVNRMMDTRQGERSAYIRLLMHILHEVEAFGFKVAVFVAGHYPLIDMARAAVLQFMDDRKFHDEDCLIAWAFSDFLMVKDTYPRSGDHGAGWETSHLMHLHPSTVDLSLVSLDPGKEIGVLTGEWPSASSTAAFGKETIEAAVKAVLPEVRSRLENPGIYRQHGGALLEGQHG